MSGDIILIVYRRFYPQGPILLSPASSNTHTIFNSSTRRQYCLQVNYHDYQSEMYRKDINLRADNYKQYIMRFIEVLHYSSACLQHCGNSRRDKLSLAMEFTTTTGYKQNYRVLPVDCPE